MKSMLKLMLLITLLSICAACAKPAPPPPTNIVVVEEVDPVDDAIAFYNRGNYDEARAILVEEMRNNSQDPRVYYYLGNIYMVYKDCKSALPMYEHALLLDPGYYEAKRKLDESRKICAPKKPRKKKKTSAPAKKPVVKKKFQGGAKAIDPADF